MHHLNFLFIRLWAEALTFRNRLAFALALFLTSVGPNAGAQTRKESKAGKQVLAESAMESGWAAVPQTTSNPWTWAGKSLREVAAWIPEQERLSNWSVDTAAGEAVGEAGEDDGRR